MFYFENNAESEAVRLVLDLFLIFEKALNNAKASGVQLRLITS